MTATNQPDRSPVPGVIPEPVHVRNDPALPAGTTEKSDEPELGRRNPVKSAIAKVMCALRGDKHMVDAYPTAGREDSAGSEDAGARAGER